MSRPQNSDRLTLEEMLAAMRRIGVAPESYVRGYRDGFRGETLSASSWSWEDLAAYKRGRRAGREARHRGAHKA